MDEEIDLNQGIQGKYSKLKIAWHEEKLKALREKRVTAPIYIRIKPTNECNHGCFYCVYKAGFSGIHSQLDGRDKIPKEKLIKLLNDFQEIGGMAATYSGGGESLKYPHINEVLKKTLENKLQLSMITNGQNLEGEAAEILGQEANWVRVSADCCDAKTFNQIRNRPEAWFEKWKENMKAFAKTKKPECNFESNYVVNEFNFDKIYQSAQLFRDLGFENIRYSPCWNQNMEEYHSKFKQQVIEQIKKAQQDLSSKDFEIGSSYERDFEISGKPQRTFSRCFYMEIVPAIGADENVYFCHNKAYDNSGLLGSIKNQSFKKLWFSQATADKFKSFDPRKSCHHQCSNDEKNRIMNEIMAAGDPRVVNYI